MTTCIMIRLRLPPVQYEAAVMQSPFVQFEIIEGVATVTLSRPEKRNALNRVFIEQLLHVITRLKSDETLRVLKLAAQGTVFCAGMDLSQMQERAAAGDGNQQWLEDSRIYCQLLSELFDLPVPTIAVVQGPVLAGGVGLVLACDLIVASEDAFFMLPEPIRGITAAIVTPLLVYRAGTGVAGQMLLGGERISAHRAEQVGIYYTTVSHERLPQRCDQLVSSILTGSKSAWAMTKEHLSDCSRFKVLEQLEASIQISATARETADAREGLAAFLEKRKPAWQPQ